VKLRPFAAEGPLARARRRWRELTTYDIWNVGIATLPSAPQSIDDLQLGDVRWLAPQPPFYYLADPFPYRHGDRHWLLVERYGHPRGVRGEICRVGPLPTSASLPPEFDAAESLTTEPAIRRDRHISYPFTFTNGGDSFCAPEMSQEDGCVIYRLERDGSWRPAHHILAGRRLVDPTIFKYEDRWWLLATAPPPDHNTVLQAYFADDIAGPWTAHAGNPIKRDAGSARPAGRPFAIGARTYRPAQDGRGAYGAAVEIMEIVALTPTTFDERRARRLDPDPRWPYPDGLHHLVLDGTRVYFDAKKKYRDYLLALKLRSA
jgi:hypothetical protein